MATLKPPWNEVWMNLTKDIALRSNDSTLKVGAVIVTSDNETVLSLGYNGDEKGGDNKRDSSLPGQSNFIHAEVNAICKMNYSDPRPRKIYLTHSPCVVCSRLIVNAKIEKVIYLEKYREHQGLDILEKRGIVCEQMKDGWE